MFFISWFLCPLELLPLSARLSPQSCISSSLLLPACLMACDFPQIANTFLLRCSVWIQECSGFLVLSVSLSTSPPLSRRCFSRARGLIWAGVNSASSAEAKRPEKPWIHSLSIKTGVGASHQLLILKSRLDFLHSFCTRSFVADLSEKYFCFV